MMNTDLSIDSVDLLAVDFNMSDYNMNYSTSNDDNRNSIVINERNTMLPLYICGKYSNNEFEHDENDDDDEPWVHFNENEEQKISREDTNNDIYTLLLGLCHHYSENNIIDNYISLSTACIEQQIEDDLPEPVPSSSINEERRRINGSFLIDRVEDDVMGIVIELKEEEEVNDDIGLTTHTVVTKRWDEEEYWCGYDHENEHDHDHNYYASKLKSTRRVIASEKMDHTLSYLVGSSSNTAKQGKDEEDSTWGYYDHASLSEQSISTPSVCECDSTASFLSTSLSLSMSMSSSMSSSMYNGRINYFINE